MTKKTGLGFALVTGASSGIGAVYADRMARRGYDLILVARDQRRLDEQATKIRRDVGIKVEVLRADLATTVDLARVEQRLRSDPQITLLINNAGVAMSGELKGADPDRIEAMIRLNTIAPTRLIAAAVPGFVARGHGTIINISSALALAPELFNAVYSGTKAFLLNLTLGLQAEVGGKGLRVQAVLPGATRTDIWAKMGTAIEHLPASILMDVDEMVDAALAGLDRGEVITLPSLPEVADWDAFTAARLKLGPNLSRDHAAARYKTVKSGS